MESQRRLRLLAAQLDPCPPAGVVGCEELTIAPIAGCTAGATVTGLDLNDAEALDAVWDQVHAAFLEHGFLSFPAQHGLTADAQQAFAEHFGEIEYALGESPVGYISNKRKRLGAAVVETDEFPRLGSTRYNALRQNRVWHTGPTPSAHSLRRDPPADAQALRADSTYMPRSSKCAMLFAEEVPASGGGETEFADMRAAWEALDAETKARISSPSMAAFHSSEHSTFRVAGLDPATFPGYGYAGEGPPRHRSPQHLCRVARLPDPGHDTRRLGRDFRRARGVCVQGAADVPPPVASRFSGGVGQSMYPS